MTTKPCDCLVPDDQIRRANIRRLLSAIDEARASLRRLGCPTVASARYELERLDMEDANA